MKRGKSLFTFAVTMLVVSTVTLPADAWPGNGNGGGGGGNGGRGEPTTTLSFVWTSLGQFDTYSDQLHFNNNGDVVGLAVNDHSIFISKDNGIEGRQVIDLKAQILDEGLYSVPEGTELRVLQPTDINDSLQVILLIEERVNGQRVYWAWYLYTPEQVVDGATEPARLELLPDGGHSINNAGFVAGALAAADLFSWDSVDGTNIVATAPDGYGIWEAPAINLFEEIAVEGFINGTSRRVALKYSLANGLETVFRKEPHYSSVTDINENGTIIGYWARNTGSTITAFRSHIDGSPETIPFGGDYSEALSINKFGDVLGSVIPDWDLNVRRPYLYTDTHGAVDILNNSTNAPNIHPGALVPISINDQRRILIVDNQRTPRELFIIDVIEQTP